MDKQPIRLPARFWVLIDRGMMTRDQAEIEWAKQQAEGAEPDEIAWGMQQPKKEV